jgi:acetyl esterase/lipase
MNNKAAARGMGVAVHHDLSYGPGPRAVMDIYIPQSKAEKGESELWPVVFFVHGGVWASGEKW